jgi:hypothetical protein
MNKFILVLTLVLFGCQQYPTRLALDCSDLTTDPDITPKKSHKSCAYKQVQISPKAEPLPVDPKLIDKR